jgi:hypothetical protein
VNEASNSGDDEYYNTGVPLMSKDQLVTFDHEGIMFINENKKAKI